MAAAFPQGALQGRLETDDLLMQPAPWRGELRETPPTGEWPGAFGAPGGRVPRAVRSR
jgi:hypothetical protein